MIYSICAHGSDVYGNTEYDGGSDGVSKIEYDNGSDKDGVIAEEVDSGGVRNRSVVVKC